MCDTEDDGLTGAVCVWEPLPRTHIGCADLSYRDPEEREKEEQIMVEKAVTEEISG